jgi:hypothetical protein
VTTIALFASMFLSIASMYWGYAHQGFEIASRWILIIGIFWLFSQWRHWGWASSIVLLAFVVFAATGLILGFDFSWMLAGPVFALVAWDLTDFRRRLRFSVMDDDTHGMEKRHIARLSLLTLGGLLLVSLALFIQVEFTFEWGVLLVVVVVLGLVQLINWFRRQK